MKPRRGGQPQHPIHHGNGGDGREPTVVKMRVVGVQPGLHMRPQPLIRRRSGKGDDIALWQRGIARPLQPLFGIGAHPGPDGAGLCQDGVYPQPYSVTLPGAAGRLTSAHPSWRSLALSSLTDLSFTLHSAAISRCPMVKLSSVHL